MLLLERRVTGNMTRFANTPFDMCHSSPVQRFVSESSVINSCLWVLGSDNHGGIRWVEDVVVFQPEMAP